MTKTATRLTLEFVGPNDFPRLWPHLHPMLKEACEWSAGQFSVAGVVEGVMNGEYRPAIFFDDKGKPLAMMILSVSQFPTGKRILEVLLASGSALKEWLTLQPQLDDYAKENECVSLRMIGREGLQRLMPEWKRTAIVLEREIG